MVIRLGFTTGHWSETEIKKKKVEGGKRARGSKFMWNIFLCHELFGCSLCLCVNSGLNIMYALANVHSLGAAPVLLTLTNTVQESSGHMGEDSL